MSEPRTTRDVALELLPCATYQASEGILLDQGYKARFEVDPARLGALGLELAQNFPEIFKDAPGGNIDTSLPPVKAEIALKSEPFQDVATQIEMERSAFGDRISHAQMSPEQELESLDELGVFELSLETTYPQAHITIMRANFGLPAGLIYLQSSSAPEPYDEEEFDGAEKMNHLVRPGIDEDFAQIIDQYCGNVIP